MGRKQLYGYLKQQTSEISHQKTWTRKENLMRKTEHLLIEVQSHEDNIYQSIDKIIKEDCRLCGDIFQMINHTIESHT